MGKKYTLPADVRLECIAYVKGYPRRVQAYKDARYAILAGSATQDGMQARLVLVGQGQKTRAEQLAGLESWESVAQDVRCRVRDGASGARRTKRRSPPKDDPCNRAELREPQQIPTGTRDRMRVQRRGHEAAESRISMAHRRLFRSCELRVSH